MNTNDQGEQKQILRLPQLQRMENPGVKILNNAKKEKNHKQISIEVLIHVLHICSIKRRLSSFLLQV